MQCPKCSSQNPEFGNFCFRCGQALRSTDTSKRGRAGSYAVQGAEGVGQFALISTIMPHTNREAADNYRWALAVGGALVLVFTLVGLLPAAIAAAAALVPITYLVYLYDVNLWRDAPVQTIAVLFAFTGILSIVISFIFFQGVFQEEYGNLLLSRGGFGGASIVSVIIFAMFLPTLAEVAKQLGPILLVRRPGFDDMIDGLTFGVAAGTAYAAFETIVAFAQVFGARELQTTDNVASWFVVILNLMIVKAVIYGTATGIAMAAFSGRGEGIRGFSPDYYANLAFAIGANVLYWLGIRLLAYAPFGPALGLFWGLVIAAALIIRVRVLLQASLLEVAIEDAAAGRRPAAATTDTGYCPECQVVLLPDALFCINCGTSLRATSTKARQHVTEPLVPGGMA